MRAVSVHKLKCELLKVPRAQSHSRYYSTIRGKSEEIRKKIAEENKGLRERLGASEREWKSKVEVSFLYHEDAKIYRRGKSEEVKKKIAEENKRLREQLEASEKEWESKVDMSLLSPEDMKIYEAHKAAVSRGHFTYDDPVTGYRVMTRLRHFWRGSCCGNACRHCIYNHDGVAEGEKSQRVFNSAFWVNAAERPDQKIPLATSIDCEKQEKYIPSQQTQVTEVSDDDDDPLLFKH